MGKANYKFEISQASKTSALAKCNGQIDFSMTSWPEAVEKFTKL